MSSTDLQKQAQRVFRPARVVFPDSVSCIGFVCRRGLLWHVVAPVALLTPATLDRIAKGVAGASDPVGAAAYRDQARRALVVRFDNVPDTLVTFFNRSPSLLESAWVEESWSGGVRVGHEPVRLRTSEFRALVIGWSGHLPIGWNEVKIPEMPGQTARYWSINGLCTEIVPDDEMRGMRAASADGRVYIDMDYQIRQGDENGSEAEWD